MVLSSDPFTRANKSMIAALAAENAWRKCERLPGLDMPDWLVAEDLADLANVEEDPRSADARRAVRSGIFPVGAWMRDDGSALRDVGNARVLGIQLAIR